MNNIHFLNPVYFNWSIGIIAALFVVLILLDFWRKPNRNRWLRLLLYVCLCLALFGLATEPKLKEELPKNKALLLTESANQLLVDSLTTVYPKATVFSVEDSLFSFDQLSTVYKEIDSLFVLGNGLEPRNLAQLDSFVLINLLNPPPSGISNVEFVRDLKPDDSFEVLGTFRNNEERPQSLYFSTFGKIEDSIKVEANSQEVFVFSKQVKQSGQFVFELSYQSLQEAFPKDDDSIPSMIVEKLPFTVSESEKPNILFLFTSLSFKQKYLKQFLSNNGAQISSRSQLTTGRFRYEFFNTEKQDLSQLTEEVFKNKDLVIANHQALNELTEKEQKRLQRFIRNGLNLLVFVEDPKGFKEQKNPLIKHFEINSLKADKINIKIGKETIALEGNEWVIGTNWNQNAVLFDEFGNRFVAYKNLDLGKVGLSVLGEIYPLILEGKQEAYNSIWTEVLAPLGTQFQTHNKWVIQNHSFIFPFQESTVQLRTTEALPKGSIAAQDSLAIDVNLSQNKRLPELWTGKYWFKQEGWHQFSTQKQAKKNNIFVFGESDWSAMKTTKKLEKTSTYIREQKAKTLPAIYRYKSISQWWFYALFLFSLTGLWIEEKFFV